MSEQKFITIDIGSTWTKAFLVRLDAENNVNLDLSYRLPTSREDISYSTNILLSKLDQKDIPKLFVSRLSEVQNLAEKENASFVTEEDAQKSLVELLKKSNFNVAILDAGASNLKENFRVEDVGKYLSFSVTPIYLENFFGNRKYRPLVLPKNTKELEIEEAFLRSTFISKFAKTDQKNQTLIAATGGLFSGTPRLSRIALIILDILARGEVAQVYFDREFFLTSFGALLTAYKQFEYATTGNWFEPLGAFVSLGAPLKVQLDWGYSQLQRIELESDEISLVPAPKTQKIDLTIEINNKEKKSFSVYGGTLGILLDAREKPLQLIFGQAPSRNKITKWLHDLENAEITKEAF